MRIRPEIVRMLKRKENIGYGIQVWGGYIRIKEAVRNQ